MRPLTRSEAVVVRALLAGEPGSEQRRAEYTGVSLPTYQSLRRKILAAGWVDFRYIPDPVRFGVPKITFSLAHPFADRQRELVSRWSNHPGNVLLWSSPQTVFGVFFGRPDAASPAVAGAPHSAEDSPRGYDLTVDVRRPTAPVYFDFEGLWSRVAGFRRPAAYPRGIGWRGPSDRPIDRSPVPERSRSRAEELVERPFVPDDGTSASFHFRSLLQASSSRRLVSDRLVTPRCFLNLTKLPSYGSWQARHLVFLHGALRPETTAASLFRALYTRTETVPFLFATSERRVLVAAVSPAAGKRVGTRSAVEDALLTTAQKMLQAVDLFREPIENITLDTNHRYDRLFSERVIRAPPVVGLPTPSPSSTRRERPLPTVDRLPRGTAGPRPLGAAPQ
ncbi:MAG: hypothetical protein L3K17_10090 [Thermoplasmata archaeon]|nr:hypothetical protein [Thermoplasmata archaeon]